MGIQVKELTENLMPWEKEYIDFSFNGHHISEFGLVAATSGDRYSFDGSPQFQDETSEINGVMGQYYWGTKIKTKEYTYNLATDGMTEQQFNDFKRLFRPGYYGQFYEDTWWDRYCYVRIKNVASFSFIPFRTKEKIAGLEFDSRIYKGECKLTLVQDKPFQFAFQHSLDSTLEELKLNPVGANQQAALRMMYYSNIPARDSWDKDIGKCCIGGNAALPKRESNDTSTIFYNTPSLLYYNPSTYDSESILTFTLTHTTTPVPVNGLNEPTGEPIYFNEILDEYTSPTIPYNTITSTFPIRTGFVETKDYQQSQVFKYSLPETFEQVNKAIKIAYDYWQLEDEGAAVSLEERLREELVNGKVMSWAVSAIQTIMSYDGGTKTPQLYIPDEQGNNEGIGTFTTNTITLQLGPIGKASDLDILEANWFQFFNIIMLSMFVPFEPALEHDFTTKWYNGNEFYDYTLVLDSEIGISTVSYDYNTNLLDNVEKISQNGENCSNIALSEYLLLDGGDSLNKTTGKIATYHYLFFNRGNELLAPKSAELKYRYTYM